MFGKLTNQLIEHMINELNKDDNREKIIIHIVDPLIYHILDKLYPYIIVTSIVIILLFLIVFMILYLLIKGNSPHAHSIRPHLS